MSRKQAREDVFRLIFALGLTQGECDTNEPDANDTESGTECDACDTECDKDIYMARLDEYFESAGDRDRFVLKKHTQQDAEYIRDVYLGVKENLSLIDEKIEQSADNWSLDRMSRVSLCALRLCVYELMYKSDIPQSASINEAVTLCGIYGGEKEKKFVNGVLGRIVKTIE